jgi:hypothetical protein
MGEGAALIGHEVSPTNFLLLFYPYLSPPCSKTNNKKADFLKSDAVRRRCGGQAANTSERPSERWSGARAPARAERDSSSAEESPEARGFGIRKFIILGSYGTLAFEPF